MVERESANLRAGCVRPVKPETKHADFLVLIPEMRNLEVSLAGLGIVGTKSLGAEEAGGGVQCMTLNANLQLPCLDPDDTVHELLFAAKLDAHQLIIELPDRIGWIADAHGEIGKCLHIRFVNFTTQPGKRIEGFVEFLECGLLERLTINPVGAGPIATPVHGAVPAKTAHRLRGHRTLHRVKSCRLSCR